MLKSVRPASFAVVRESADGLDTDFGSGGAGRTLGLSLFRARHEPSWRRRWWTAVCASRGQSDQALTSWTGHENDVVAGSPKDPGLSGSKSSVSSPKWTSRR
jgi:hypothetical protein